MAPIYGHQKRMGARARLEGLMALKRLSRIVVVIRLKLIALVRATTSMRFIDVYAFLMQLRDLT